MTDQLISDLGQISALRVISRTTMMAYKHASRPVPQIARELNVDAIVEGTVLRSGDQVRITAQLIEASADKHRWSGSYQGELRDTLELQNKVASAIAEQIQIHLNPQEQASLKSSKTVNPEAYQSYLKGRYFWNKRTADGLKVALAYFNQALEEDPNYAQPYSGLADAYALLGDWQYGVMTTREALPRAKAAAIQALKLDSGLAEAHNSLAFCLDGFDWDWASAEREFRRAIELDPGLAIAHHWYAWHLALLGRHDEALAEMRKAQNLDPLSLIINADLAELLVITHSYDEAILQSRKTIELDPTFGFAHHQLGQAYLQKHMNDEAVAELEKAVQLSGHSPTSMANLARAYAVSGRRTEAMKLLGDLKKRLKCWKFARLGNRHDSRISRRKSRSHELARKGLPGAVQSRHPHTAGIRFPPLGRAVCGALAPYWPASLNQGLFKNIRCNCSRSEAAASETMHNSMPPARHSSQ